MGLAGVGHGLQAARDALRTQLWPLPTIGVVLALALGVLLPLLDTRIADDLPAALTTYLFGGGAGAARSVLEAVAGSLITVTSLTFSLTVVTLQLASSQFSPRLLRTFTRDRFVHATLALFLATFTYALTVLRTVRSGDDGQEPFVPQVSVTVAFVLALASVLGLVLFLAHLAREIRVETVLRRVRDDAVQTVRRLLPERVVGAPAAAPTAPAQAVPVPAAASGFLVGVDEEALLEAVVDADAVVVLDRVVGTFVVDGTPVGFGWPRAAASFDDDTLDRLVRAMGQAVTIGVERTGVQDVGYGLRQLTDVAVKALSPGINDPTTAVHALGHLSALLCELSGRDLGHRLLCDDQGRVRVVLHRPSLAELLDVAVAQPRRYGASEPSVLARLFVLLRELAWCAGPGQREAVVDQLALLRATTAAGDVDPGAQARLRGLALRVDEALLGRWEPGRTTR